jgi:hypothetical protein
MKHVARNMLALACLAACASPALADAYGSATIGNVTVTVIDLDPNDGIAAGIAFMPDPTKYYGGALVRGYANTGPNGSQDPGTQLKTFFVRGAWQATNVHDGATVDLAHVQGDLTGSGSGVGFSDLSLEGAAGSTATGRSHFWGWGSVPGNPGGHLDYVLAANTKVVFSIDASLNAGTTIGHVAGAPDSESAMAMVGLYASGTAPDGTTLVEDLQERTARVAYVDGAPMGGGTDSWSGVVTASFSNVGLQGSAGEFWAYASIEGDSVVAAVPEPSTWAMLLGGLAFVGTRLRRRVQSPHPEHS